MKKNLPIIAGVWLALAAAPFDANASSIAVSPAARTECVGDHLAILAIPNGVSPSAWQWEFNGTNIPGQTSSSLSLTNIQLTNTGTYTVVATVSGPSLSASAVLNVSNGPLPLLPANLIVARVGDGLQTLNTTMGNTLYLDQFVTNGSYASTIMVPDSGSNALIVEGSGATVGQVASVLTLAADGQYLNFAGYNTTLPNGGVTFTGGTQYRAIGAVSGAGVYSLVLTNNGAYNGGTGQVRCAVSTEGNSNTFWTTGIVASPNHSIKVLTPSQGASGIPSAACGYDPRVVNIFNGVLWVSSGNNSAGQSQGLYSFTNLPTGSPSTTAVQQIATGAGSDPNDFAFSPDGLTVYIADDDNYTGSSGPGGVERWDFVGGNWTFNYTLATGAGNWGASGLTVDFSRFSGGSANGAGAVVYATTTESSTNRIIQIVDTQGASSSPAVLATAGPNQMFRGLRFGPQPAGAEPMQSIFDDINVVAYGAKGDGVTDDTVAFQNALNAATNNHNGIYIPMGRYVISGTLNVGTEGILGKFTGGWPADTMPMPTILMHNLSGPGLALQAGASLHGFAIVYDQGTPTSTNAPAISLQGDGISISSLRIQNAYDGINTLSTATPGRARFTDIYIVSPAHVGIEITKCYDFVQYHHIEVRCPTNMSSGAAFAFGRVDEGSYTGLLASNCLTGLEFDNDPSTNPAGGNFTGGFAGASIQGCANGVIVNGAHKVKLTGGDYAATHYGICISNNAAEVTLMGGQWNVGPGPGVEILNASNVIIDATMFARSVPVAAPQVIASNCQALTLSHCQFLPGSTGVVLGANIGQAVVSGNMFNDGTVSNGTGSGSVIVANSLKTVSAPSGVFALAGPGQVALSWYLEVEATNYHVLRSLVSGGPYTLVAATTNLVWTDTSVTNGVTYYYAIAALTPSGQSPYSSEVSATPQAFGLSTVFAAANNQLTLSWPAWATNLTLYMTTNLAPPAVWTPVGVAPQSNDGLFYLTLPTTNSQQEFFELSPP